MNYKIVAVVLSTLAGIVFMVCGLNTPKIKMGFNQSLIEEKYAQYREMATQLAEGYSPGYIEDEKVQVQMEEKGNTLYITIKGYGCVESAEYRIYLVQTFKKEGRCITKVVDTEDVKYSERSDVGNGKIIIWILWLVGLSLMIGMIMYPLFCDICCRKVTKPKKNTRKS